MRLLSRTGPRLFGAVVAACALGAIAMPAVARDSLAFTFRVMTFNIRLSGFDEGTINAWKNRADLVAETVRESKVSVVCFQEDMSNQVDDLRARLGKLGWQWKGRGRNANGRSETCSIAFDTNVWQCVEAGDFWLSDTPDVPGSITWGTKYPHKVTWARLESLKGHHQVLFTSTHFDESPDGNEIRRKSAQCIRAWLARHVPKGDVVACGDFNSAVEDPSHAVMTSPEPGQQLQDAFDVLHPPEPSPGTCHEFTGVARKKRIDWILYAGKLVPQALKIDRYSRDGRWPSDHFAVWTEFEISGEGHGRATGPEPQVK
jgi:endonuclease/exonuclease/phosphatase family metal-dependent hydrolase